MQYDRALLCFKKVKFYSEDDSNDDTSKCTLLIFLNAYWQAKHKIGTTTERQGRSEACTKLYTEGREAFNEMISIFSSCITNQTDLVSKDIQRLTDAVNILKSNVTKDFQDALQCLKNPLTVIPCFTNVSILINCYILILKHSFYNNP